MPASSPLPPRLPSAIPCPNAWCAASSWRGWPISSKAMPPPRRASPMPSPPCWTAGRCPRPGSGQGGAGEILALYPLFADLSHALRSRGQGARLADQRLALCGGTGGRCGAGGAPAGASWRTRSSRFPSRPFARRWSIMTRRSRRCGAMSMRPRHCRACATISSVPATAAQLPGARQLSHPAPRAGPCPSRAGSGRSGGGACRCARSRTIPSISRRMRTHPWGRCISTGGYHNAMAAPALDDLAAIWADLCLLCDRHGSKLLIGRVSHLPDLLLVGREAERGRWPWQYRLCAHGGDRLSRAGQGRRPAHLHSRQRIRRRRAGRRGLARFLAWAKEAGPDDAWMRRWPCWR